MSRAKQRLLQSMNLLLKEYPFEAITVEAILHESRVSRTTFYRCFRDKHDLMNWFYLENFQSILKRCGYDDWGTLVYEVLCFELDNRDYFNNAFMVRGQNSFEDFAVRHCAQFCSEVYLERSRLPYLDSETRALVELYNVGCIHTVKHWLRGDVDASPESFTRILCSTMAHRLQIVLYPEILRAETGEISPN